METNFENSGTTVTNYSDFGEPFLVQTIVNEKSIELVYKEVSNSTYLTFPAITPVRVFKVIYSCKNGKWNKSERIHGEIVPACDEYFVF